VPYVMTTARPEVLRTGRTSTNRGRQPDLFPIALTCEVRGPPSEPRDHERGYAVGMAEESQIHRGIW